MDPRSDMWAKALCKNHNADDFFADSEREGAELAAQAIAVCHQCPIRTQCLTYALDNDLRWGIWGGFTGKDRDRMCRGSRVA